MANCLFPRRHPSGCEDPRWLLPRVLGSGREENRCFCATLRVSGLPCGAPPFYLEGLEVADDPPRVRVVESGGCMCGLTAQVEIPLIAYVRDGCGQIRCGTTSVTVRCRVPEGGHRRGTLMATADVRLIGAECAQTPCFEARLALCVEVYRVRLEPCGARRDPGGDSPPPRPPFYPHLPMYPQPRQ